MYVSLTNPESSRELLMQCARARDLQGAKALTNSLLHFTCLIDESLLMLQSAREMELPGKWLSPTFWRGNSLVCVCEGHTHSFIRPSIPFLQAPLSICNPVSFCICVTLVLKTSGCKLSYQITFHGGKPVFIASVISGRRAGNSTPGWISLFSCPGSLDLALRSLSGDLARL